MCLVQAVFVKHGNFAKIYKLAVSSGDEADAA
jgi:hypothetical protein